MREWYSPSCPVLVGTAWGLCRSDGWLTSSLPSAKGVPLGCWQRCTKHRQSHPAPTMREEESEVRRGSLHVATCTRIEEPRTSEKHALKAVSSTERVQGLTHTHAHARAHTCTQHTGCLLSHLVSLSTACKVLCFATCPE